MKLGLFTVLFQNMPFEAMLDLVVSEGLQAIEIGSGGYPGKAHCDPQALLADPARLEAWQRAIQSRGLELSALSCHGNPLHPQKALAEQFHRDFINTVLLAERIGLDRLILFSGCPGDSEGARHPNFVSVPWPSEFQEVLEWQWKEKVIPYWREQAAFAREHGIRKLCFEMHPGFVVYNVETLMRLRTAVGDIVGANLDPSHLYWQGAEIVAAIRALGSEKALFHVHVKDTAIDPLNAAVNGILDTKPLSNTSNRSWLFRTVGYGHSELDWRRIVGALLQIGYDDVLSIEHEDALCSPKEGLRKAVSLLKQTIFTERPGEVYWS